MSTIYFKNPTSGQLEKVIFPSALPANVEFGERVSGWIGTTDKVATNDGVLVIKYCPTSFTSNLCRVLVYENSGETAVDSTSISSWQTFTIPIVKGKKYRYNVDKGTANYFNSFFYPFKTTPVNDYSTDEQVIGTWLGKPLYRKVFKGTSDSTSQTSGSRYQVEIPLSSSNDFDFIKSVEGWLKHSSGTKINVTTLGLASSGINTNIYTRVTNGQPLLSFQTNVSNVADGYKSQPYEIALEYTKTTD